MAVDDPVGQARPAPPPDAKPTELKPAATK